jgi:hypothetical protein
MIAATLVAAATLGLVTLGDTAGLEFHGPYQHENLAVYLITGEESVPPGTPIITLAQAMASERLVVHETGDVNTLAVENIDAEVAVFIQAGEIVKGGRQDRVLGVDLLVHPKSGRIAISAFCVESGRWSQRDVEDAAAFSGSSHMISGKGLRKAVKADKAQGEVWRNVAEEQDKLSANVGKDVRAQRSASSFQLSLEDADLERLTGEYTAAMRRAAAKHRNAIGAAIVVNGEFRTADVYGSRKIFAEQWPRLLEAAIHEAIADYDPDNPSPRPTDDWQKQMREGKPVEESREQMSGTVESITRTRAEFYEYETRDLKEGFTIHQSWDQRDK